MPSTRLTDLDTDLAHKWLELREAYESARPGHALVVTATHRPVEEQQALYQIGRIYKRGVWILDSDPATQIVTQLDGTAGRQSKHNLTPAQALDFCVVLFGKSSFDPAQYLPIGELAKKAGLVWGGDFSFRDYGHLEAA